MFQLEKNPFNISCKAGLVVMNSFSFFLFLFWKTLYLSFNSEGQLCQVEYSWLAVFFFQQSEYIMLLLLAYKIFVEKYADSLMGVHLYITSCFLLLLLRSSLSLTFHSLITLCLCVGLFRFILFGTVWAS